MADLCQLPVEADFIDPESEDLDERYALKVFIGKTPEQAEILFQQNFLFYQEELEYMKANAFRFYLLPALAYIRSATADNDSDAVSTLSSRLESRLADISSVSTLALTAADTIRQILSSFDRFDCDCDIYGDVPSRYRDLLIALEL